MPAHGVVSGARVDDLTGAIIEACKKSGLILGVQVGLIEGGVELRFSHGTVPHLHALLLNLAAANIFVDLVECEVASSGEVCDVTASGLRVVNGELCVEDLSSRARAVFVDVSDGHTIHEDELIAGHVAAQLLGRDPHEFHAVRALSFKRKDGR